MTFKYKLIPTVEQERELERVLLLCQRRHRPTAATSGRCTRCARSVFRPSTPMCAGLCLRCLPSPCAADYPRLPLSLHARQTPHPASNRLPQTGQLEELCYLPVPVHCPTILSLSLPT